MRRTTMSVTRPPLAIARTPGDDVYQAQVLVLDPERRWWLWGWGMVSSDLALSHLRPLAEEEAKALLAVPTLFALLAVPVPLTTDIATRPPQIVRGEIRY
jgi:hypothetical protein